MINKIKQTDDNNLRIEFKPFVKKKDQKYRVIGITDIQLHTNIKRPTRFIGKLAKNIKQQ